MLRPAPRPAIVFCATRTACEQLARTLRRRLNDEHIFFYHAGLSREEKHDVESWFFHCGDGVLIATCAYGMGVDKSNIRTVIHHDLPPSVEAYLQESGRAGRDGERSEAILLYSATDLRPDFRCTDPAHAARRQRLLGYLTTTRCRREYLLGLLGGEVEACFGCDCCDGTRMEEPQARALMVAFVRHASRRYRPSEAVSILLGRSYPRIIDIGGLSDPWFGAFADATAAMTDAPAAENGEPDSSVNPPVSHLKGFEPRYCPGWSEREVKEALGTLQAAGHFRVPRFGLFRRHIVRRRRRHILPVRALKQPNRKDGAL